MLSFMSKCEEVQRKFGYKVKLMFLTIILKEWLHLIGFTEPPSGSNKLTTWSHMVATNSRLNGATLSLGWLQIAYPIKDDILLCSRLCFFEV